MAITLAVRRPGQVGSDGPSAICAQQRLRPNIFTFQPDKIRTTAIHLLWTAMFIISLIVAMTL